MMERMSRVKWATMIAPESTAYMTAVAPVSHAAAAVTGMATAMTPAVATVTSTMATTRISDGS